MTQSDLDANPWATPIYCPTCDRFLGLVGELGLDTRCLCEDAEADYDEALAHETRERELEEG